MISLFAKKAREAHRARGRLRNATAALWISATLVLAACGPQETTDKTDAAAPAAEPVVLTALVWAPDWAEEMHRVADAFTKEHPQVRIDLQFMIGNSVEENLKPKVATGNLPDIISVNPNPYAATLADQGLLADLSATRAWNGMLTLLQDDWTSPGKRHFGIPSGLATTLIYYNRDMFAQAGITRLPEDFDAFLATAETLKKAGFTPLALSGAFPNMLANGPFSYGFANNITSHVPDWRERIAAGTLPLDTKPGADIFAKLKQLADKKLLQRKFMGAGYDETLRLFANGKAAMTFQGSWAAGALMHSRDFRVGVFAPPWNAPGQPLVPVIGSETGIAVSARGSEANRKAALAFVDYLYGPGFAIWQGKRQNIPPFKKMPDDVAGDRELFALVDKLEQAQAAPGLYYSYLPANTIDRLHALLQAVLYGTKTPVEAARLLHNSISDQARTDNK